MLPSSTSTMTSPLPDRSLCQRSMMGIILRQGAHLRKPNSSQTTLPLRAPSFTGSAALIHWCLAVASSGGALPKYELPNLFCPGTAQSRTAASRIPLVMVGSLLQLRDDLEDRLGVLGRLDGVVLVDDLAVLVDDESPAH